MKYRRLSRQSLDAEAAIVGKETTNPLGGRAMSETINTTGLQRFGPQSRPEVRVLSMDTQDKYAKNPLTNELVTVTWTEVTITTLSTTTANLSAKVGITEVFSGDTSMIATTNSVQTAEFANGSGVFVLASWDATGVILARMTFASEGDRLGPSELPSVGVWLGTSSGGGTPPTCEAIEA
jgi:hypothetical protein